MLFQPTTNATPTATSHTDHGDVRHPREVLGELPTRLATADELQRAQHQDRADHNASDAQHARHGRRLRQRDAGQRRPRTGQRVAEAEIGAYGSDGEHYEFVLARS